MTDEYTGNVAVGGPPQTREIGDLTLTKVAVGPMDNNAYFLRCRNTGDVVLIDAAHSPDVLLGILDDQRLQRIVTTHQHADHWQALPEVVAATGAPVAVHPEDADPLPVTGFEPLVEGDQVEVGDCRLTVIHLVGHTPGSIALLYEGDDRPHLFTGDSLFPGGHGLTTRPEDHESLMDDLEAKIFGKLPDETWFYPGHGSDSTLGAERPHLAEWRERGW
ncbi:MAG TPA: MBL fold metallo-hydrolase [Mycobacteriales bacterium]|nr:MBL fold metallo-hydrolase [Mycobacteriales bacterium]